MESVKINIRRSIFKRRSNDAKLNLHLHVCFGSPSAEVMERLKSNPSFSVKNIASQLSSLKFSISFEKTRRTINSLFISTLNKKLKEILGDFVQPFDPYNTPIPVRSPATGGIIWKREGVEILRKDKLFVYFVEISTSKISDSLNIAKDKRLFNELEKFGMQMARRNVKSA